MVLAATVFLSFAYTVPSLLKNLFLRIVSLLKKGGAHILGAI